MRVWDGFLFLLHAWRKACRQVPLGVESHQCPEAPWQHYEGVEGCKKNKYGNLR